MSQEEIKEEHKVYKNRILQSIEGGILDESQDEQFNPENVDITEEQEREDIDGETPKTRQSKQRSKQTSSNNSSVEEEKEAK